jgi:hypothetical protein
MLGGAIASGVNAAVDSMNFSRTETFQNGGASSAGRMALVSFLTVFIVFALILLAGKWLWNNVLVVLVPAIKPAKSVWQILGLAVLIGLLHPGCTCTM